jgi:CheY-like chemotaxis protein
MHCENIAALKHLCADPPPHDHTKKKKNRSLEKKEDQHRPWKILIVEDEVLVAENMREILESSGYIVADVLTSGDEVVAKYSGLSPDLIIMDVKLPGKIDGVEAANLIQAKRLIPVIFLTAYSEDQFTHISFLPKDSYRYINKPFDLRKLPEFIQRFRSELNDKPIPHDP